LTRVDMRRIAQAFLVVLFVASAAAATPPPPAASDERPAIRAVRLPFVVPGDGAQAVRADAKGRARVLTQRLELFALEGTSGLHEAGALKTVETTRPPFLPALSSDGCCWLVNTSSGALVLFEGEEGKLLPKPPVPADLVLLAGDDPLVGTVLSAAMLDMFPERERDEPPLLWTLSGSEWRPLLNLPEAEEASRTDTELALTSSVVIAADAKGRVWVADEFAYAVRKLSPAGSKVIEVIDPQVREPAEASAEAQKRLEDQLVATGVRPERITDAIAMPSPLVRAMTTWAGDAFLLLQLRGGGDWALDRIDGSSGDVRRVRVTIDQPERIRTMAATADGLVLAAARARDGLFLLAWDELEPAWTEVPGLERTRGAEEE